MMKKKFVFNNGWIALIIIFLTLFSFIAGFIAGFDIPQNIEIGFNSETIFFLEGYYNLSTNNLSCISAGFTLFNVSCNSEFALINYNNNCYGCHQIKEGIN